MKQIRYLYFFLPFSISFFSAQGILNDNHYIKLFGFVVVFLFMLIFQIAKRDVSASSGIKLSTVDLCVLGLLTTYIYFWWGTSNILDHYYPILYILFYFYVRFSVDKTDYWKILTNISLVVISMHLIICGLQYFSVLPNYNSYFGIGSTFGNPDMMAAYLAVLIPMCYKGENLKIFRFSVSVLTVLLFFFLQARTAIVATAVAIFADILLNRSFNKKILLTGTITSIIGIAVLAYWHLDSFLGRIFIWITSALMIVTKPFGWGLYAFEKHHLEYQAKFVIDHPKITESLNVDVVHSPYNEFLNLGVTLGLVALIIYVSIVFYVIKIAYRSKSPLLFPVIVYQIISLSYFPFRIIPLTVIYILLCAIIITKEDAPKIILKPKVKRFINGVLIMVISIYAAYGVYSFFQWKYAVTNSSKDKIESQAAFEKSYKSLKGNGRYLTSYAEFKYKARDTVSAFNYKKQAENYFVDIAFLNNLAFLYEQKGCLLEAKNKYDLAVKIAPNNANIRLAQIMFLKRIGEEKAAYDMALLWNKKLAVEPLKTKYRLTAKRIENIILNYEQPLPTSRDLP